MLEFGEGEKMEKVRIACRCEKFPSTRPLATPWDTCAIPPILVVALVSDAFVCHSLLTRPFPPPCPVRRLVFHRPHPSPRPFSLIPSHSELRFSIVDFPILVHLLAPPRRPFPFPPTPFHRLPFLPHPFPSLRLSPRPAIPAPLIVIPLLFFTWPPHSPSRRVRCRVLSFRLSSHPLPNLACAPRTVPVPHSSKAPPHSAKQFRLVRRRRDGAVEPGIRDRCRKA